MPTYTHADARTILTTAKVHHATKAKAIRLMDMLEAEYPGLTLVVTTNEDDSAVTAFATIAHDEDGEAIEISAPARTVPDLADLLEECEEQGVDPEAGPEAEEDEELKAGGSVVPEGYRAKYRAASSNGQTCGDWLAEALVADTNGQAGFQVEDFTQILSLNGVSFKGAWARLPESGQKGWIGRYRMNGRQVLEKVIAERGTYIDLLGHATPVPEGPLADLRTKHAKWLAKQAKLAALADATAGKDTPEA